MTNDGREAYLKIGFSETQQWRDLIGDVCENHTLQSSARFSILGVRLQIDCLSHLSCHGEHELVPGRIRSGPIFGCGEGSYGVHPGKLSVKLDEWCKQASTLWDVLYFGLGNGQRVEYEPRWTRKCTVRLMHKPAGRYSCGIGSCFFAW